MEDTEPIYQESIRKENEEAMAGLFCLKKRKESFDALSLGNS